jgi:hypothetical protein
MLRRIISENGCLAVLAHHPVPGENCDAIHDVANETVSRFIVLLNAIFV